jgi:hypothetical protein
MRSVILALIVAVSLTLFSAAPALAVPIHLHCLHTPGTVTAIASGLTRNGPQGAFDTFHAVVHQGAFVNNSPSSPVFVTTTSPTGSCD